MLMLPHKMKKNGSSNALQIKSNTSNGFTKRSMKLRKEKIQAGALQIGKTTWLPSQRD
jgi:hypothetical protein